MSEGKRKTNIAIVLIIFALVGLVGFCIIGVLAAIAVPNFLEAQVRAKVARSKAEMRTISIALEANYIDNKVYPASPQSEIDHAWMTNLTTPISYLSNESYIDPFSDNGQLYQFYNLKNVYSSSAFPSYILYSAGPDTDYDLQLNSSGALLGVRTLQDLEGLQYDSSNGTISNGDIIRFSTP